MRKRFEQQLELGQLAIEDIEFTTRTRDRLSSMYRALKEIYITPEYNEKVFTILEEEITQKKKSTGRMGMNLWMIFVLAQTRLCLDSDYDELLYRANYDKLLRHLMGVEVPFETGRQFKYQTIVDNVSLLSDEVLKRINEEVILKLGEKVFKKTKRGGGARLKTDSYVVGSNVHFPTDYNLLWDSGRKCLDIIEHFLKANSQLKGWRKVKQWKRILKNGCRSVGRANAGGGKNKEKRLKKAARDYIKGARRVSEKLHESKEGLTLGNPVDYVKKEQLIDFLGLLDKHIDLLERRVIKGEKIPHDEKIFSIFERYTEWINKGKLYPSVELGKKLLVTTNKHDLIVDFEILEHQSDSESVDELIKRMIVKYKNILSWSFDKGFYSKTNKEKLDKITVHLVLPKRGKLSKKEIEEESCKTFKKFRNRHSAVESNINELEHCGVDRCPDRGYEHFKQYISLGVTAYNLKKIGKELLLQESKKKQKEAA